MILAADIGGTKLLFGLFDVEEGKMTLRSFARFSSTQFSSVEEAMDSFLSENEATADQGSIQSACISVAGPVVDGTSRLTNLGWLVEEGALRDRFPRIPSILLRNDMEAIGKGLALIEDHNLISLTGKEEPHRKAAPTASGSHVIGLLVPGTGLGEAFMIDHRVMASEGGHRDLAPRTKQQSELWEFLPGQYGHVSYERVLSGSGLCTLVRFWLRQQQITQVDVPLLPEEITKRARAGGDGICTQAVKLFVDILGAEAGNLALATMALDGVYLGGGIIRALLPWMGDGPLLDAFVDKGRFAALMKTIPVYAVLDTRAALFGSARMAANDAGFVGGFALYPKE